MPSKQSQVYFEILKDFLNTSQGLASGPNKYKSLFGKILEGAFRKDYFTLQSIFILIEKSEDSPEIETVVGGSILDLSRRIFEDMINMVYISQKGKDKYSDRFLKYQAIEQKGDMDFLIASGVKVKDKIKNDINKAYDLIPKNLRGRKNWSGQDIEKIVTWFFSKNLVKSTEKEILLKSYIAGNRKNHTSPGDIMDYTNQKRITGAAERDVALGLMVSLASTVNIAILLIDEIDISKKYKAEIKTYLDKLARL